MYKYIFGVYSSAAPQQSTGFNLGGEEYMGGERFLFVNITCPFSCRKRQRDKKVRKKRQTVYMLIRA